MSEEFWLTLGGAAATLAITWLRTRQAITASEDSLSASKRNYIVLNEIHYLVNGKRAALLDEITQLRATIVSLQKSAMIVLPGKEHDVEEITALRKRIADLELKLISN